MYNISKDNDKYDKFKFMDLVPGLFLINKTIDNFIIKSENDNQIYFKESNSLFKARPKTMEAF